MANSKIIVALDGMTKKQAIDFATTKLDPTLCRLKIGMELFTAAGLTVVEDLHYYGFDVFLDLKFKDIPNTVAGAVKSAADLGVWMCNIHCDGGSEMMEVAVNAIANYEHRPLLIGVTVLTSMNQTDLVQVGLARSVESQVLELGKLGNQAGLDGFVCSAQEAPILRESFPETLLITPGIRLAEGKVHDQKRVVTPDQAIKNGSDYLVIGRPITQAKYPEKALLQCVELSQ